MSQRIICCHILPNLSWVYQPILCPDLINSSPYCHTPIMNKVQTLRSSFLGISLLRLYWLSEKWSLMWPNVECCMWHSTSAATQGMMREQVSLTVNKASRSLSVQASLWQPDRLMHAYWKTLHVQGSRVRPLHQIWTQMFFSAVVSFQLRQIHTVFLSSTLIISCFGYHIFYQ